MYLSRFHRSGHNVVTTPGHVPSLDKNVGFFSMWIPSTGLFAYDDLPGVVGRVGVGTNSRPCNAFKISR